MARVPLTHLQWKRLGFFKHGKMENPEYAKHVCNKYSKPPIPFPGRSLESVLELGPGEGGYTFGYALAAGCRDIVLVSPGKHFEPEHYLNEDCLRICGTSIDAATARSRTRYLTRGLASFQEIHDQSIDLVFSHTVLQHVRLGDLDKIIDEMFRVTRSGGIGSHRIDFRDMLGGSINHLRISKWWWEQDWFAAGRFYTNRLRHSQMINSFKRAGFEVVVDHQDQFKSMPAAARHRSRDFADLTDEDLLISGCDLVVRKPRSPTRQ